MRIGWSCFSSTRCCCTFPKNTVTAADSDDNAAPRRMCFPGASVFDSPSQGILDLPSSIGKSAKWRFASACDRRDCTRSSSSHTLFESQEQRGLSTIISSSSSASASSRRQLINSSSSKCNSAAAFTFPPSIVFFLFFFFEQVTMMSSGVFLVRICQRKWETRYNY